MSLETKHSFLMCKTYTAVYYISSGKQTLSLFGSSFTLDVDFPLCLSSIIPPPSHLREIWNLQNTNMKFSQILGNFPVYALPASHRPLCSVFHQMRRIASNPLLHRVNSVILLNPFLSQKPQNHRRANPMMDPWPQMLTCDPGIRAGQWERISFQGWDPPPTDSGSQTHRTRHWTELTFSVYRL